MDIALWRFATRIAPINDMTFGLSSAASGLHLPVGTSSSEGRECRRGARQRSADAATPATTSYRWDPTGRARGPNAVRHRFSALPDGPTESLYVFAHGWAARTFDASRHPHTDRDYLAIDFAQ
jgi:hypothetical protein